MKKTIAIAAPAAIGPYSHACTDHSFIFTSGQLGINPETGKMEEGVSAQTTRAIKNLQAVLEAAGATLDNVLKTTVFVTDLADFAIVNEAYKAFFGSNSPARSCVQVAALPAGGLVEIEAVASV